MQATAVLPAFKHRILVTTLSFRNYLNSLQDAERETGRGPVTKAVISVPAYFDEAQREATIAAGAREPT